MKEHIMQVLDEKREKLQEIAQTLRDHPEIGLQEYESSRYLADVLEEEGFAVTRKAGGMDTAFLAVKKNGNGPRIAITAEYDALPGNGHACGHHLIAAMSVGAGIALASALERYEGEVAVIGTPAEETGDGKPVLMEKGVFDGFDVAMMVHPSTSTCVYPPSLCIGGIDFNFTGEAVHAGGSPEKGINALDAVVVFYSAVNAMRQQLKDGTRVHGIILEAGSAVNVIPDKGRVRMEMRAKELSYYHEVVERVINCAKAAAMATGCKLEYAKFEPDCHGMKHNHVLGDIFTSHMEELGICDDNVSGMLSTDMGNVSQEIPAIHPMIQMAEGVRDLHTQEFLQATDLPYAKERALLATKALALTGLSLLEDPGLVEKIKAAH